MPSWSAENATKAYLQALKMGKMGKEPSSVEFLAALAAGNNSQLMVMAGGTTTALALVCASRQTGGRAVCICRHQDEVAATMKYLGQDAKLIEFAIGDIWKLLSDDYLNADFVLFDCKLDGGGGKGGLEFLVGWGGGGGGAVVVGYNAHHGGQQWWRTSLGARFLPIGGGLLVGGILGGDQERNKKIKRGWILEVDEFTGEEHFYKVTSPRVIR